MDPPAEKSRAARREPGDAAYLETQSASYLRSIIFFVATVRPSTCSR
jgi:hypothetical protein